ncbi:MAG: outer membrane beta-barrel protein [Microscillaceae bacterium]|nr:outer membrane beta-barrel protein [Microscillaceae bacterium]
MKRILICSIFFTLFQITDTLAQLRIGTSFGINVPVGNVGTISKNGYGGSLSGKYHLSPRFAITSNFSFYLFGKGGENIGEFAESFGISQSTINLLTLIGADSILSIPKIHFFPVNVGFEYYILQTKVRPYVGFDIGLYTSHTESIEVNLSELIIGYFEQLNQPPPPVSLGSIDLTASDANFGMAAVLGLAWHINDTWSLDFNGKYNGIFFPDKKAVPQVMTFNLGVFYQLNQR